MSGSKESILRESTQRLLRRGAVARVRHLLEKTRPEDIAHVLPQLITRERRQVFDLLKSPEVKAEVLSEVDGALIPELLDPMPVAKVIEILYEVHGDDVADILAELEEERAAAILAAMRDAESDPVEDLMGYAPDTAGGIMSPDFFALDRDTTVQEAIRSLQEQDETVEMAFYVYVVNEHGQLVGVVSLRQLVMSKPDKLLSQILDSDVITVDVLADQEEVARIVARYNFLALPVVDAANKILGIVTVDDIIDVLYEEATEDILKLAGAGTELSPSAPVGQHLRMRYPWLVTSCISGVLASLLLGSFMHTLGAFLVSFVPVVMGMAGNVGMQSSTVVVRGIATGAVSLDRTAGVIRRELLLGVLLGTSYGLVVGSVAAGISVATGVGVNLAVVLYFGLSVGLALGTAMLVAATMGTMVPIGLHRLGVDPAVATGPFVTSSLDVIGILSYFGIATGLAAAFGL